MVRQRVGRGGGAAEASDARRLAEFLAWMRSVGIWWDDDLLSIEGGLPGCSGPALGVNARAQVRLSGGRASLLAAAQPPPAASLRPAAGRPPRRPWRLWRRKRQSL